MGVNIYILDRRSARLSVGGVEQNVGSLRRFWKITEMDGERSSELDAAEAVARTIGSPTAAMLADVHDMPLASNTNPHKDRLMGDSQRRRSVHQFLHWESDLGSWEWRRRSR